MDERDICRRLRHKFSANGWALLIYYFIMNASVIGFMIMDVVVQLLRGAVAGDDVSIENAMLQA